MKGAHSVYKYQLVEFTSSKRMEEIRTTKFKLAEVLFEIYSNKIETMFDDNGVSKGYISVFVNANLIWSIKDVVLNPKDEICIVTSISGG